MRTRVTELLGIEQPIIQGAMAHIADASLASAVSAAGGLGIIACGGRDVSWISDEIDEARRRTDRPIGVNVMLMDRNVAEVAQLLADKRVEVITTGAGSPAEYLPIWKAAGCKVVPVIAAAAQARRMERLGADAVVAEGQESGGHIGELTTMALVPAVCQEVSIPVIAAGGIADGRGMAAVIMLGAEGVQMGTRFLTVAECTVHENYKAKVIGARDSDTIVTGRGSGHPVRGIKNAFSRKVKALENEGVEHGNSEVVLSGSLARAVAGDVETGAIMSGQIAGIIDARGTAKDVVDGVVSGCELLMGLGLDEILARNAARNLEGVADVD